MGEHYLARLIFKSNRESSVWWIREIAKGLEVEGVALTVGIPYEDENDEKPSLDIFTHTDEALCVLMAQLGIHIEDEGVNPLDIIPIVIR